jgi:hypothetical protein
MSAEDRRRGATECVQPESMFVASGLLNQSFPQVYDPSKHEASRAVVASEIVPRRGKFTPGRTPLGTRVTPPCARSGHGVRSTCPATFAHEWRLCLSCWACFRLL